jgi:hypothetical protein
MKYTLNGVEVTREEWLEGAPGITPGKPPCIQSDTTFMAGRWESHTQHHAALERAGHTTQGKVYLSSLARFPGDPRALVDSRGDVRKICEQEGWNCEGSVNVKGKQLPPRESTDVAEDIVQEHVEAEIEKAGGRMKPKEVADTREKVKNRLRPHWKKKRA